MDERSGRRGKRWLEMIHTREVSSLARRYDIALDDKLVRFLQEYSEVVLHVTSKQKEKKANQFQFQQELEEVNRVVQEEVRAIRKTLFPNNEEAERYFFAVQHQETYLPIVHLAIRGVPELLVHVTRAYATRKKGISFGLLSKSTRGVLWGATARAANYLRHRCRNKHWDLSVSEVVNLWYQQALEIPPEERMRPEKAPSSVAKRRRSIRRQTRLREEVRTSAATADREVKERKVKRALNEGDYEHNSNHSPTKTPKRRRTDVADIHEMQEASAAVAINTGQNKEGNTPREDKGSCLKSPLSASLQVKNVDSTTCGVPEATIVATELLKRQGKKIETAPLESRRKTVVEKLEEPGTVTSEEETDSPHDIRALGATTGKENSRKTQNKGKLEASAFLTAGSQARRSGQDREFKQVDVDEGFDTIGGLADYDSEESDYDSAGHNGEYTRATQQIRFEQVDADSMDNSGDDEDERVVEVGKVVENGNLESPPREKRFSSFRFADALSAVNLAGNDGGAEIVKREEEEQMV